MNHEIILLTCHLSHIFSHHCGKAGKITRNHWVNYDSCRNYFLNREMCFTFGSLVAVRVIHDEIREIYLCRFWGLQRSRFSLFNTSQTIAWEVLSLGRTCFIKPCEHLNMQLAFSSLQCFTVAHSYVFPGWRLHFRVVNLVCVIHLIIPSLWNTSR